MNESIVLNGDNESTAAPAKWRLFTEQDRADWEPADDMDRLCNVQPGAALLVSMDGRTAWALQYDARNVLDCAENDDGFDVEAELAEILQDSASAVMGLDCPRKILRCLYERAVESGASAMSALDFYVSGLCEQVGWVYELRRRGAAAN